MAALAADLVGGSCPETQALDVRNRTTDSDEPAIACINVADTNSDNTLVVFHLTIISQIPLSRDTCHCYAADDLSTVGT